MLVHCEPEPLTVANFRGGGGESDVANPANGDEAEAVCIADGQCSHAAAAHLERTERLD